MSLMPVSSSNAKKVFDEVTRSPNTLVSFTALLWLAVSNLLIHEHDCQRNNPRLPSDDLLAVGNRCACQLAYMNNRGCRTAIYCFQLDTIWSANAKFTSDTNQFNTARCNSSVIYSSKQRSARKLQKIDLNKWTVEFLFWHFQIHPLHRHKRKFWVSESGNDVFIIEKSPKRFQFWRWETLRTGDGSSREPQIKAEAENRHDGYSC